MTKIRRITEAAGLLAALYCARRYFRNWGTTKAECQMRLPGDTLVGDPAIQVTEAVYIDAPASAVWPQVLQDGDDGGFYGFERQRNPVALANGDRAQSVRSPFAVGDVLRLAPAGWMRLPSGLPLIVAEIVPEQYVVLHAKLPNLSWEAMLSFHLQPHWEDRVRLLVRARIALRHPGEVFAMELARPVIAMAARGLLLGTKHRAERVASTPISASRPASETG